MRSLLLIRYGVMRYVGWFSAEETGFDRGDRVVVETRRGAELGEVVGVDPTETSVREATGRLMRPAGREDLHLAAQLQLDQSRRLTLCEATFGEGQWPFDLIDVEVLLDDTTVLYYLGPYGLETDGLQQAFRERWGLSLRFEPVGADEPEEPEDDHGGCGSCGSSSGGGCGSGESGGGCGSCGVKDLVARRRAVLNR